MSTDARPPRLAERLLCWLLPSGIRDAYAGDLEERFAGEVVPRLGVRRARLWYWWRVLTTRALALRRAAARLDEGSAPPPRNAGTLFADVQHAARALRRDRGVTAVIVATLGIAMAATTLAFTIVDAVLLRPLPYPQPSRVVALFATFDAWRSSDSPMLREFAERFPVSWPLMNDWRSREDLFDGVAGYRLNQLEAGEEADAISAVQLSDGLLSILGVAPLLGRVPEDGQDEVVLSYGAWQGRHGGSADVLGGTLRLSERAFTIVGVMPRSFWFVDADVDVFMPLPASARVEDRQTGGLSVIARLRPGVSLELAGAELSALAQRLAEEHEDQKGYGARVASLRTELVGDVERTLIVVFAAVCFVLLVACTNVANLMLVRSTQRARDLAVRAALGAGRLRLVRSALAEGLLVALMAGTLGMVSARLALPPLLGMIPDSVPRLHEVTVDLRVGLFVLAVTVATALLVGILPGLRASRAAPAAVLREGGRSAFGSRRTGRMQSLLVVTEVAMACVLVVGGALLARSYARMLTVERGYDSQGLAVLPVNLPRERYEEPETAAAFHAQLIERVRGMPGIEDVTTASEAPFSGSLRSYRVQIPDAAGGPTGEIQVNSPDVDTAYFAALGVTVLEGRTFEAQDLSEDARVVVVNRAFARRFWPEGSAVGRIIEVGQTGKTTPHSVIGVVADVLGDDVTKPADARMYTPFAHDGRFQYMIVRSENPAALLEPLRAAALEIDPLLRNLEPYIVEQEFRSAIADPRLRVMLIGALAGIGSLLALLGVYGLLAWRVVSSIPAIGLRLALGARPAGVEASVVGQGVRLAALGVLVGVLLSLVLTRTIRAFLFDIAPTDPLTYVGTAAALLLVAALASWLPARRAARVDPVRALTAG